MHANCTRVTRYSRRCEDNHSGAHGKMEEVENLIAELARRGLAVDVLVNNGAISPLLKGTFCDTTLEYWEKVLEVNLTGPFLLSTRLGQKMAERGSGAIISISRVSVALFLASDAASYTTGATLFVDGGVSA